MDCAWRFFGAFQAIMPILGWLAGNALHHVISGFDHWIALALLVMIGLRMIYPVRKKTEIDGRVKEHAARPIGNQIAFDFGTAGFSNGVYESMRKGEKARANPHNIYVLLTLSVATSIDALAIGISLSFLKSTILLPAVIIGLVTFVLSFVSFILGNRIGRFFGKQIEVTGGLILIGIGIKILIEHLG